MYQSDYVYGPVAINAKVAEKPVSDSNHIEAIQLGHKLRSRTHQDYIQNFGAADVLRQHFRQVDEDFSEEILGDEYITLRKTLASIELPPAHPPSEPSKPFGEGPHSTCEGLDLQGLIRQRKQHHDTASGSLHQNESHPARQSS
jgi:hypothetical protein